MPTKTGKAYWQGAVPGGEGRVETQSGALAAAYSFATRFEDESGANPEELLGAAHASCYAMAFSLVLGQQGYSVDRLDADAAVTIEDVDGKPTITASTLSVGGRVNGISATEFRRIAEEAKDFCPVSRALTGVKISLQAELANG